MAVNMLLSYAFADKDDLAELRSTMPCGRLLIDSGAFTAASVGKRIELAAYAEFLTTWAHVYDHAVTLDVIGDPVATRRNTHALHRKGINVLPVFTRGGTVADFDAMVRDSGYVCVGGGVGMPLPLAVKRLRALQVRAEELGGGIHALGVGNMTGLRAIRPYSADASSVSSMFRFGKVAVYDGGHFYNVSVRSREDLRKHLVAFKAQGLGPLIADAARTGRQRSGKVGRTALMRGMSVAYAAADEDLVRHGIAVPKGVHDSPGTHLYSAVTGSYCAPAVAELDGLLHSGAFAPPMWQQRQARHRTQCRAPLAQGAA